MLRALSRFATVLLLAAGLPAAAQAPTATSPIRNLKVLEEYPDGRGNLVRVVQFSQGMMRVTQTIIMPKPIEAGRLFPIRFDTIHKELVTLVVDKSDYSLLVLYNRRPVRNYKVVFGPSPLEDKRCEGDRCTPEGSFTIQTVNPRSQYNKFMLLSYPNDSAKARFARLQAQGLLPKTAKIGHSVGIHGIWPGGDDMIEMGVGWTDGCVALRNSDVDELYALVGPGTKVIIRK